MILTIQPGALCGSVTPPASKSLLHRALICAALGDHPCSVDFRGDVCEDVLATVCALRAFGARIEPSGTGLNILPSASPSATARVDCRESGSTLRFLLPVAAALGIESEFVLSGRLPERPMSALIDALRAGGCDIRRDPPNALSLRGRLRSGRFELPGNVSSQFISGMLLALSLCDGDSELRVTGGTVSAPYIGMTLDMLRRFGARIDVCGNSYHIYGRERFLSPDRVDIPADPSAAAFWHCAARLPGNDIMIFGLDECDTAGDSVAPVLFDHILKGPSTVDLTDVPDLAAPLSAFAAAVSGRLTLTRIDRLRQKESDRVRGIVDLVNALGGSAEEKDGRIEIFPADRLRGGRVDSRGDHRLAMAAAVVAPYCLGEVTIPGAECVRKSYPGFLQDFKQLGGRFSEV